jgi:hypothetical protein
MFDLDRSASRGEMATRKLIIFEHNSAFGEAPAHKLFGKIKIEKKKENEPPRSFDAYEITFHNNEGITEALNSDQTVITISVKEGGELELNTSPDWNK